MPLIGRLDKQVKDMLITPLEKKRDEAHVQPPERKRPPGAAEEKHAALEKRAERDELPVWLL